MSFQQFPSSPVPRQRTPSPKLSCKPLSPLTPITTVASSSPTTAAAAVAVRQITKSPVIKAVPTSAIVPPITLSTHHSRSNSVPSLQRRSLEANGTATPPPPTFSSSANLRGLQSGGWSPKSPTLRPLMSPGPVTPMQLEDDLEYRFPSIANTPIRRSPLVVPVQQEEESGDGEQQILDMQSRNR